MPRTGAESLEVSDQPAMMHGVRVGCIGGQPIKYMGNMARAPDPGFEHTNDLKNMRAHSQVLEA